MRELVFAFVAAFALSFPCRYLKSDDVISSATGIDAVRDLVLLEECRDAIDLSPDQLIALQKLLATPEAKKAANEGKTFADRFIQSKLIDILAKEQIRAMRIAYLRRKYNSANLVFRSELMEQIGIDVMQATAIAERSESSQTAFRERFDAVLRDKLKSIISELPATSQRRLQCFFGTDLFPSLKSTEPVDVNTIALFEDDRGPRLYTTLKLVDVAKLNELTVDQIDKLRLLGIEASLQRKNGPQVYKRFVENGIKEILRPEQHIAIIQRSHSLLLRLDIATMVRQEFLDFIALENESKTKFLANVERGRAELLEMRAANDRKMFNEGIAAFPKQREMLVKLFEDVW